MDINTNSLTLVEAALKYAELGWPVLPLHTPNGDGSCSCKNQNCERIGKHPRVLHGVNDATVDEEIIKQWWEKWPDANIGIAAGITSNITVLDIDPKDNGHVNLAQLEEEYGKLPQTLRARSGSGGQHIFFNYLGGFKNSAGKIREGIDIRTQGGYIVAAPSLHVSGNRYQWIKHDSDIAEMPEWLKVLLREASKKSTKLVASGEGMIPEGQRNSTLFGLACSLRSKGLAENAILAAAQGINQRSCNPPLEESEVARIVESAAGYDLGNLTEMSSKVFRQTDLGNAQRLVMRHGQHFRYCPIWKKFLTWDSKRFAIDNTGEIYRMAKETVKRMYAEAAAISDEIGRKKLAKHAMSSESANRIKAMIELAQTEQGVPVLPDELDTNDWLLNTNNGTIDLQTGELQEHSAMNLITKLVPVDYDVHAQCPTWLAFLNKIMGGNEELIHFLQKAIGYSLTGSTREQCMFILYGAGCNGKSTFLNAVQNMLADYAQQTPTESLLQRKNEGIPNDVARLKGARFVTASEVEQGRTLAESLIKQMTGGDKLTARFLHGEFFEFTPKFKLFLATNHKPNIRGTDNGIWRRIRLIPFTVTIPEGERDSDLPNKLKAEMPGILNWAVEGCRYWLQEGLAAPREVSQATDEYRSELDWLQAFIDEKLKVGANLRISAFELYSQYQEWCSENGEHEYSQRILGMRLKDRGFFSRRSGRDGSIEWHGLGSAAEFGFHNATGYTEGTEPNEAELAILQ